MKFHVRSLNRNLHASIIRTRMTVLGLKGCTSRSLPFSSLLCSHFLVHFPARHRASRCSECQMSSLCALPQPRCCDTHVKFNGFGFLVILHFMLLHDVDYRNLYVKIGTLLTLNPSFHLLLSTYQKLAKCITPTSIRSSRFTTSNISPISI